MAPGIRIALRGLDIDKVEEQMVRGEVDVAFMTPSAAPANLRSRHLFDERYVLIGRRGHTRLAHALSVAEYAALEHVVVSLRGSEFTTPVDAALNRRSGWKASRSAWSGMSAPTIMSLSDGSESGWQTSSLEPDMA